MTPNIGVLYTVRNYFHHEYGFEIITSKKGSVWLKSTGKVSPFCMKKCADHLSTFVMNGRNLLEEQVEVSHLESRTGSGSGWRMTFCICFPAASHAHCTASYSDDLVAKDQPTPTSTPPDHPSLARVCH